MLIIAPTKQPAVQLRWHHRSGAGLVPAQARGGMSMIIAVASGKGGTGKTTVATNVAASVKEPVQLLDCDVEAPNAHLFLHPTIEATRILTTPIPEIDLDTCDRCSRCVQACRFRAIAIAGEMVLTFPELCHSCGGCLRVCPHGAITETGRELGVLETGRVNGVSFAHGRMRVGEAMAPPLIRKVREYAGNTGLTVIDAPPGTSCPVIAAIKDTDFVLLVTEPTPFGLHDLTLAVETVRTLGMPMGLVINRADMGSDAVREYARTQGVPVLMEIPFDRRIAESYSRGEMVCQVLPVWKDRFRGMIGQITTLVEQGKRAK